MKYILLLLLLLPSCKPDRTAWKKELRTQADFFAKTVNGNVVECKYYYGTTNCLIKKDNCNILISISDARKVKVIFKEECKKELQ